MSTFKEQARDSLADDLRYGKKVAGLTLSDLIDSDLSGPRFQFATIEVVGILLADYPDSALLRERYLDFVITRWLDEKEDHVREVAAEMARDYEESQRAA